MKIRIANMLDREIKISLNNNLLKLNKNLRHYIIPQLIVFLSLVSIFYFYLFYKNGLGLSYNDARSHLDIGRRVVEGLHPGLAQLGSVWLPLPHLLMVPLIWNNFLWHSGLAGSLQSMISFVFTGFLIYKILEYLKVGLVGRIVGVFVFVANLNVLYLQSIAMTEMLLLATMTAGVYELMLWSGENKIVNLIKSAFWIMLSTLVRYDGWFLLIFAAFIIGLITFKNKGFKTTEGTITLFFTLAGFGVVLWLFWNQLIFKDALYFVFGPFSAHAQQLQLEKAGNLATKGNLLFSLKIYLYAMFYNSYTFPVLLGAIGAIILWIDKNIVLNIRLASIALLTPLLFNILALYMGHSVLFIQGLSGNTWFNVRYGIMMMPSIAVFIGYLIHKIRPLRLTFIGLLFFVTFFGFMNKDAVTIDDARVGASQKNVSEVSGYLKQHAVKNENYILISAASHDAIIFSSGLPMRRFIHEGTGKFWDSAVRNPDRWARWIVMRTYDYNDLTWAKVNRTAGFKLYNLVAKYPFADVYELKSEYLNHLP